MTHPIAEALRQISMQKTLTRALAEDAFGDLMDGRATEPQKGAILLGIAARGETSEEIAGAVAALRRRMRRVSSQKTPLLDTCGPGGLGRDLFNISTAAAIVAAGAGAAVAKHGNRSISSRVGSADVLSACGLDLDLGPDRAGRILDEAGLVFLFAPAFHPAMKALGPLRRELGVRTIFNVLGPLANPAGATRQLIGVGRPELVELLSNALAVLGCERAIVFHSANGLDELVPGVPASGIEVRGDHTGPWRYDPESLAQKPVALEELSGQDASGNAAMLLRLLGGESGPRREAVLLNAAAALVVEGRAADLADGYERSREAIDRGDAGQSLERLRQAAVAS